MPSIGEVIHDQTGLGEPESQDVIVGALQDAAVGKLAVMPGMPGYPAYAVSLQERRPGHPGTTLRGHDE